MIDALQKIYLRCTECGDCWLWSGALCGGNGGSQRHPSMHFDGKTESVRRVVYKLKHGSIPAGRVVTPKCGQRLCVSEHCLEALTVKTSKERAAKRGAYSSPAKNRRGAITKRAKSRITEAVVEQIKNSPGPSKRIAAETGVSASHVKAIRRGTARREYSSPFAGLGARA